AEEIRSAPAGAARSRVQQVAIDEQHTGQRLDRVLTGLLPGVPRSRIFRLIRKGEVRVNGRRASPEQRLQSGDKLRVPPVRDGLSPPAAATPMAPRVPLTLTESLERSIVFEDEKLIALNKPAGVAVHGGSGLSFGV